MLFKQNYIWLITKNNIFSSTNRRFQIQSIFSAPNIDISEYKRGQITFIQLHNFRSVTHLELMLSPKINYVLGCNGVGKSTINMAILLACGSKNPELKDLIQEGKDNSTVIVWICTGKGQAQSKVIMRRRLTGITTDYFYNSQSITLNGLKKKMQYYNIYIDNPFMSMTQFDSQKILKMSGDKKLEFVQQLSNTNIKKLSYDNMQKEFQELDQCLKYYNGQRNEFQQAMAEFTKQNVLKELKLLKRDLRKVYVSCCYCDTQEKIQQQKIQQKDINDQYNDICTQIEQSKNQQQIIEQSIDSLKIKEQEQFREMNQNTQVLEKYCSQVHQQQYNLIESKRYVIKLLKMKEQADSINMVELQNKRQEQQQQLNDVQQQLQKLQQEQQKLTEEISTGTNIKDIEDQQKVIQQFKMELINIQTQKINQCLYGNQQLRTFYNDQFFEQNNDDCNVLTLKKFVVAGGDTMIRLSRESMIPNQTRQQILLFTCSVILRTIYSNDLQYTKRLEEINMSSVKNCTISYVTKFQNYTYNQFISYHQQALQQLKENRVVNMFQLSDYNILQFIDAFEGNPFISYQIALRLQSYYYLDKIKLENNQIVEQNEADQVCNKFLQNNKNAIGIVFQDTLYRSLKYNNEIIGTERIKLQLTKFRCLQPQEKIYDILQLKMELQQHQQKLMQLKQDQNNQQLIKTESQNKLKICKQDIQKYTYRKNQITDVIEQYTNAINNVRVVTPIEIEVANNKVLTDKTKLGILIQRMVEINNKIIKQYDRDKSTLNEISKLRLNQDQVNQQLKDLQQKQELIYEKRQQIDQDVKQLNYLLQQQTIDIKEFSNNDEDLYQFAKQILKDTNKLYKNISKYLHISNPVIQAQQLQDYINITTTMLKQNSAHQIHDLPQLQSDICKNLNKVLLIYAKISIFANKFINNVQILNDQLEKFVQQLSEQFKKNLSLFNVGGELQLKIWSENMYQKKFQDFLSYFTKQNISQNLGEFYKIYMKYYDLCDQQQNDYDDNQDQEDKEIEIKPLNTMMDEFDQQAPDEFQQAFESFTPITYFTDFENIVNNLRPAVQILSRFSSGAKQQNIILSGGEQSVTTLCIAACCKKVAFLLSDEINQNLDSKFEVAAHNLVCSLDGQAIISSPKIDVGESFDDPKINIIILSKNYHSK